MDVFIIMLRGWRYSLQDWRANIKNCHQEFMSVFRISVLSLGFFCEYSVKNYHHQEFNVNFIYKISVSSSGYSCEYNVKNCHHQDFNVNFVYKILVSSSEYSCEYNVKNSHHQEFSSVFSFLLLFSGFPSEFHIQDFRVNTVLRTSISCSGV